MVMFISIAISSNVAPASPMQPCISARYWQGKGVWAEMQTA
jgi:hypothetical protein